MFGWFRNVTSSEAMDDLRNRLVSSQKDATYWRNEYGNKVAELVEAKEKAELERNLNAATINDLQVISEKLQKAADRWELSAKEWEAKYHALAQKDTEAKSVQKSVKNCLEDFVVKVSPILDRWERIRI